MKSALIRSILLLFACISATAQSAEPKEHPIVFRGFLIEGPQLYASLEARDGKTGAKWVGPGDVFLGYQFTGLNQERTAARLSKNGKTQEVPLLDSTSEALSSNVHQDLKLNAEAVERLFVQMQLDRLIEQTMSKQKEILGAQLDQLKQATGQKKEISEAIDKALSWDAIKGDLIIVYSQNYTAEELRGISDFYNSPVGKALVAKQEKVATDTMLVLQKRIQQATSAISKYHN